MSTRRRNDYFQNSSSSRSTNTRDFSGIDIDISIGISRSRSCNCYFSNSTAANFNSCKCLCSSILLPVTTNWYVSVTSDCIISISSTTVIDNYSINGTIYSSCLNINTVSGITSGTNTPCSRYRNIRSSKELNYVVCANAVEKLPLITISSTEDGRSCTSRSNRRSSSVGVSRR